MPRTEHNPVPPHFVLRSRDFLLKSRRRKKLDPVICVLFTGLLLKFIRDAVIE